MITIYTKTKITLNWPGFKDYVDGTIKGLLGQYDEVNDRYTIFCFDHKILYNTIIFKVDPNNFTAQQISDNAGYRTDFEDNFKSNFNKQIS